MSILRNELNVLCIAAKKFLINFKQFSLRDIKKLLSVVILTSFVTVLYYISNILPISTTKTVSVQEKNSLLFVFSHLENTYFNHTEIFCDTVKPLYENQLKMFLNSFYNESKLEYGHNNNLTGFKRKIKQMPQKCLKNIFVKFNSVYLQLEEYRDVKVKQFESENSLHVDKGVLCKGTRCVLQPETAKVRPWIVVDNTTEINEQLINYELNKLRTNGIAKGDDDLENLDYLKSYMADFENQGFKVPNLVHFVWFSCHAFRISEYLCVLSALRKQNPDFILVHGDCEPRSEYWNMLRREAGEKLKFIKKSPPESIFGKKVVAVEHQSDVARLHILLRVGGMYFDTDAMVLRSLDDLRRDHDIVLGKESILALANGIIVANRNSWFLKKWFLEYQSYKTLSGHKEDPEGWGRNSVQVPLVLWQRFPDQIHVIEVHMVRPNGWEMKTFYNGLVDWSKHWTIHVSTRWMPEKDKRRTFAQFALLETTYGEVARFVLWGSTSKKDVKPWMLHPDFNKL